jgi:hypothetical protein
MACYLHSLIVEFLIVELQFNPVRLYRRMSPYLNSVRTPDGGERHDGNQHCKAGYVSPTRGIACCGSEASQTPPILPCMPKRTVAFLAIMEDRATSERPSRRRREGGRQ